MAQRHNFVRPVQFLTGRTVRFVAFVLLERRSFELRSGQSDRIKGEWVGQMYDEEEQEPKVGRERGAAGELSGQSDWLEGERVGQSDWLEGEGEMMSFSQHKVKMRSSLQLIFW